MFLHKGRKYVSRLAKLCDCTAQFNGASLALNSLVGVDLELADDAYPITWARTVLISMADMTAVLAGPPAESFGGGMRVVFVGVVVSPTALVTPLGSVGHRLRMHDKVDIGPISVSKSEKTVTCSKGPTKVK